jgi:hypothetical protein
LIAPLTLMAMNAVPSGADVERLTAQTARGFLTAHGRFETPVFFFLLSFFGPWPGSSTTFSRTPITRQALQPSSTPEIPGDIVFLRLELHVG